MHSLCSNNASKQERRGEVICYIVWKETRTSSKVQSPRSSRKPNLPEWFANLDEWTNQVTVSHSWPGDNCYCYQSVWGAQDDTSCSRLHHASFPWSTSHSCPGLAKRLSPRQLFYQLRFIWSGCFSANHSVDWYIWLDSSCTCMYLCDLKLCLSPWPVFYFWMFDLTSSSYTSTPQHDSFLCMVLASVS